jgi:hypothetical protein
LWLWPEVQITEWSAALEQFESIIRAVLAGKKPKLLQGEEQSLALAGYTSGIGPTLGSWAEARVLPAAPATFAQQLAANRARMSGLKAQARQLVSKLTQAGIGVMLLKGAHTAVSYWPEIGCRPMSDIDILIRPDQRQAAEHVLNRSGFERIADRPLESSWRLRGTAAEPVTMLSLEAGDPWSVDLHLSLDVEGPPGARPARLSLLDPFALAQTCDWLPEAVCLGQPLLLIHLAAHIGSGFQNITLARLLELLLVIRADTERSTLDWNSFLTLGKAADALSFAFPALHLARSLSPADVPEEVVAQCALEAPAGIRRLVATMTPASAHGIHRRSVREHYAWTRGISGWLRRLGADLVPDPASLRSTAAIHRARATAILGSYSAAGRR